MRPLLIALFLILQFNNAYANSQEYLITPNSVGQIKIGMNLKEIKKSLDKNYRLQDQERAEVNSIALYNGEEKLLEMFFEGNKDSCQDKLNEMLYKPHCVVESIEVDNPKFFTKEGIHAGMTISEIERIYGKSTIHGPIEIESEVMAFFQNAPKTLWTMVGECDLQLKEKCTIVSLRISRHRWVAPLNTNLEKNI